MGDKKGFFRVSSEISLHYSEFTALKVLANKGLIHQRGNYYKVEKHTSDFIMSFSFKNVLPRFYPWER